MQEPHRGRWLTLTLWRCDCKPHPLVKTEPSQPYIHTYNEIQCRRCQALRPRMVDRPREEGQP